MPTRPTSKQVKAANQEVSGQKLAAMVANANPAVGAQMASVGVAQAVGTQENGNVLYSVARDASISKLAGLYDGFEISQNPFFTTLVNVIGLQVAWFRTYSNSLADFKRGRLGMGETVEEIVNDIPKPHRFSPAVAESEVFRRELPKVYAAYFRVNMKRFYKQTTDAFEAKYAFKSWNALGSLWSNIVASMSTAMAFDDKYLMLYTWAIAALKGYFKPVTVPAPTDKDSAAQVLKAFRLTANQMTEESRKFNANGVYTNSPLSEQRMVMTYDVEAAIDIDGLASIYHLDKAEYMGRQTSVLTFHDFDWERFDELFTDPETGQVAEDYHKFTNDEVAKLSSIIALHFDRMFVADYEGELEADMIRNPQGRYINRFLHKDDIYAVSPNANAVAYVTTAPTVETVAVTPAEATVAKGSSTQLSATLTGDGLYSSAVTWEVTGATASGTTISQGLLKVAGNEGAATLTVKATAVMDTSKSGTATITVSGNAAAGKVGSAVVGVSSIG